MQPAKPRSSGRTRSKDTLTRILDAAERLFAQSGYGATSLRAVAAAVGIQNPSIYSHFESKRALYEAVLERAIRPILEEFWEDENELELLTRHLAEHPHFAQLLLKESASDHPQASVVSWARTSVERTREWHARVHPTMPIDKNDLVLRALAVRHVVMGFFASSQLVHALTDTDPLSEPMLQRQMVILEKVGRALFAEEEESG